MLLGILSRRHKTFRLRGSHPLWPAFQDRSPMPAPHLTGPAEPERKVPQPRPCNARRLSHMERFSLIRVRSPLLTESLLFSLPAGTEMFHFPAFPPRTLCVQMRVTRQLAPLAGFPHSDTLGSQSGYRLPQAYRRFLRPSSAPNAKASTVCS